MDSQDGVLPKATHRGFVTIAGYRLTVHHLDNGGRVFEDTPELRRMLEDLDAGAPKVLDPLAAAHAAGVAEGLKAAAKVCDERAAKHDRTWCRASASRQPYPAGMKLTDLPIEKRSVRWIESEIRYQQEATERATTYCACHHCGETSRGGCCGACWGIYLRLAKGEDQ